MQDINNINLDSMNEKENMINKEIDLNQELIEQKIINNKTTKDNLISEHKKCVPLQIYQKVYLDKQKLISEINNLNNEINNLNKNNTKLPSLENEIKDLQRNLKNYENALIKQEKFITILKSKISKLEKQIIKKNEEIANKDNTIFELNDQVNELSHKIQNMKEMFRLDSQQELLSKNDEINMLKNQIEINQKKMEFKDKKYQNLQNKYLKLLKSNKDEKDGLIFSSLNNINKSRNNYIHTNVFFSSDKINDNKEDNDNLKSILETIDVNNLNRNKINDKNGKNIFDKNLIQENNQRYLSPTNSFINKNENQKMLNLLPILNKENKKKPNMKIKLINNKGMNGVINN